MKQLYPILCLIFLASAALASGKMNTVQKTGKAELPGNYALAAIDSTWHTDTTSHGLTFYFKVISCNAGETILLAVKNANSVNAAFAWGEEVLVDGSALPVTSYKTFSIPAMQSAEGTCDNDALKIFAIALKEVSSSGSHITGYRFKGLEISL